MCGNQNFDEQIVSLKKILKEHPNARVSITGGEPSLYIDQVNKLVNTFKENGNNTFLSINTTGYDNKIYECGKINLSVNQYVKPNLLLFPNATYQTVIEDKDMTLSNIKNIIDKTNRESKIHNFSFRFLSGLDRKDYSVDIWNELENDKDIKINTFRVGDFFVYATFEYKNNHCRITLGDMWQQQNNDYKDGYSNIIIHPSGEVNTNWK